MVLLYQFAVQLGVILLRIAGLFSAKWSNFLSQRKSSISEVLHWAQARDSDKPILCFHCASLGEYEMIAPLLAESELQMKYDLVVSFFSASGYAHVQGKQHFKTFYLPLDTRRNMRRWVEALNPQRFVFVRYDLWLNLMQVLRINRIATYLVNARIHSDSFLAKWYGAPWRNELKAFKHIFAQDEASHEWFIHAISVNVSIQNDLRFDRVVQRKASRNEVEFLNGLKAEGFILIGGSSWPEEERLLFQHLENNPEDKLILAPHDLSEAHLAQIHKTFAPLGLIRFSSQSKIADERVIVLDTIGLLADAYAYADIAVVGGGFGSGLHNVLEAAVYGLPIVTGPNIHKDTVALDMAAAQLLFTMSKSATLSEVIQRFQSTRDIEKHQKRCIQWVAQHSGSTKTIARHLA